MADPNDMDLMQAYAEGNSEAAFAELVRRHVNLVYSVAFRFTGQSAEAQDVAQSVFIILAKKAASLRERTTLTGWLYETTRLVARQSLRTNNRQRIRDQEAYMQSTSDQAAAESIWQQMAPMLEDGMARLSESDRTLLALRFFENKSASETAALLGIQEWAAHKRANRAVEKLRAFFTKRGVTLSAAGLTTAMAANSVQSAPVGLAASVTAAALSGTALTSSAVLAATKTIAMTTLQKTLVTAAVVVLAGAGIYEARRAAQLREQNQTLQQQQAPLAEQNQQLQPERDDATNRLADLRAELAKARSNDVELKKLRGEVTRLKNDKQALAHFNADEKSETNSASQVQTITLARRLSFVEQYLGKHPEQRIPELQFAGAVQWLNAVLAPVENDDEMPDALFKLRNQAQSRFMQYIRAAVRQFEQANNGQFPGDLSQLQNYFDPSVEEVVSQNYEILPASTVKDPKAGVTGDWIIKRKTNVNPGSAHWLAVFTGGGSVWYDSAP